MLSGLHEVKERAERASATLTRMIGDRSKHSPDELRRLVAKREGIEIVLGYINEEIEIGALGD